MIDPADVLPPNPNDPAGVEGDLSRFDPAVLAAYEKLRAETGLMIFCNAKSGERIYNWCGWRSKTCSVGVPKSAHKSGKALDLHCYTKEHTRRLWDYVKANGHKIGIKRLEAWEATKGIGTGWVHIDTIAKAGWEHGKGVYRIFYIYLNLKIKEFLWLLPRFG